MSTVAELFRNPDLEEAILEAPLDPAPRMVYGDWLAAQGDPRGPWFALSAAVEAAPLDVRLRSAATELFHANGRLFLGQGVGLRPNAWFGWLGGFLDEVRLHPFATLARAGRAAKTLFSHPHARFLRHVALGNLEHIEEILETLATEDLPLLESLTAIDGESTSSFGQVEIDRVLARPTMRSLGARRVLWSDPVPHLRELHLFLIEDELARIGTTMKNLESLTLDFRHTQVSPRQIARLLGRLPKLKTLRLLHPGAPDELLAVLTPPPPGLTLIDVSHCPLGEGAQHVLQWPAHVAFRAIRTDVPRVIEEQIRAGGRSVFVTRPSLFGHQGLRDDTGEDTWLVHRAKTDGRDALRCVPDGGRELFESAIRTAGSETFDLDVMDVCVTLPCERWHVWPWASAASARSWKKQYELSEAIAREGLMREPREPNFYAFVIYGLRRQDRMAEAVAEVARAEAALRKPPRVAQETGAPLCLIDCMYTLAQAGDHAAALALADRLPLLDDPNLQAMRAMCHVAARNVAAATEAMAKAAKRDAAGLPAYVNEPARRAVYDHALAAFALMPKPRPGEELAGVSESYDGEIVAMEALERAWPRYPERNWFKTDPNLAAIHEHPRFIAMLAT